MNHNKKYIIITPSIINMGGAQMYVRNKYMYMQENGWEVDVISAQKGNIYISDLQRFTYFVPEFEFYIYLFSKSTQDRIVNQIIQEVIKKPYDEIIIESTCTSESTWAEVIAQKINAKHFFFNLQERDHISSKNIQKYLLFKHYRRELAGIHDKSLLRLFSPFHPISNNESYFLQAFCSNVVEDIPSSLLKNIDVKNYNYIVGCLSRLDKPFVLYAVNDFVSYAQTHKDKTYLLLMIGGAPDMSICEQKIRKIIKNTKNVELFITGYTFPVPTKLLDICNAFFSSSGGSWVCMRTGIPTISYDATDFRPIGILGRTTNSSSVRSNVEIQQDFSKLMDDILERKLYVKESQNQQLSKPDFSSHDEFISSMSSKKEYFCFDNLSFDFSEKKLSLLLRLIGAENYSKLGAIKKSITNSK